MILYKKDDFGLLYCAVIYTVTKVRTRSGKILQKVSNILQNALPRGSLLPRTLFGGLNNMGMNHFLAVWATNECLFTAGTKKTDRTGGQS